MTPLAPRDRLIVALDMPDVGEARRLVERIGESAAFYKVGMELAMAAACRSSPNWLRRANRFFSTSSCMTFPTPSSGRRRRRPTGREVPDRPRLSADDARGGRRRQRIGNADPRRHGPDLLRRRRSFRRGLPLRRGRDRPAASRASARARRRRTGGERGGSGDGAPNRRRGAGSSSPRAFVPRAARSATRSGSPRLPRRSATAPTTWSLAARSPRRPILARPRRRSSRKSRGALT